MGLLVLVAEWKAAEERKSESERLPGVWLIACVAVPPKNEGMRARAIFEISNDENTCVLSLTCVVSEFWLER